MNLILKGKTSFSIKVSDDNLSQNDSSIGEIIWLLKCVMSGYSVGLIDDLRDLLSAITQW